jgi:Putative serine esterase (DUF676)
MSRLIKIADWSGEKRGNVVFVHGLGGHPYDTWRRRSDDGTFWPLWLAQDIKGLAVYSLGYQSPPTNWIGTAMPLLDEAAHALRVLANSEDLKTGPIAFVCHSLGGLIAKQVLRAANEQRSDPHLADFLLRTRQVVFIATPHTGSGTATSMERLRFIAWGSDSARDLVANKPELRDLNFGYRELAKTRGDSLGHLVYYEMVDTLLGRIVNPASADPGLADCRPTPIREDHVTIAKPRRRDDLVYAETKSFIAKLAVEPAAVGELRGYPLEPFKIDWSWQQAVPKLVSLIFMSHPRGAPHPVLREFRPGGDRGRRSIRGYGRADPSSLRPGIGRLGTILGRPLLGDGRQRRLFPCDTLRRDGVERHLVKSRVKVLWPIRIRLAVFRHQSVEKPLLGGRAFDDPDGAEYDHAAVGDRGVALEAAIVEHLAGFVDLEADALAMLDVGAKMAAR